MLDHTDIKIIASRGDHLAVHLKNDAVHLFAAECQNV
jgi:hypothetical protein